MKSIKGIIFDYGGTIDTNGVHWGEFIWNEYRKAGIGITREEFRNSYVHGERSLAKYPIIGAGDTFHTLLDKKIALQFNYLSEKTNAIGLTREMAHIVADNCYTSVKQSLAVTRPIVEQLSNEYPMVLVTNFYGNMPVVLDEFGLDKFFKTIVESSVVGLRKPDPALFALGIEALNLEAENIIVIGDSYRKDIYPSSTLGCKTVWLKNICWEEEAVDTQHTPTATIKTLLELPQIIKSII